MTADLLKFRCYRCNQLLAVSPNKVGAIVACPKCKADLVVPGADTPPKPEPRPRSRGQAAGGADLGDPASKSAPLPDFLAEMDTAIPADVADLRPEDLRVEAEFFSALTRKPPEPAPTAVPNSPEPVWSEPSKPAPIPTTPFPEVGRLSAETPSTVPQTIELIPRPPVFVPVDPVVPAIAIETTDLRTPANQPRIVHEVILPASVVLAWSVFVLFAIALAFLAGLLLGHFLWK